MCDTHAYVIKDGKAVPRQVEIVDALPMNAIGKVTKFVLRDRVLKKN